MVEEHSARQNPWTREAEYSHHSSPDSPKGASRDNDNRWVCEWLQDSGIPESTCLDRSSDREEVEQPLVPIMDDVLYKQGNIPSIYKCMISS